MLARFNCVFIPILVLVVSLLVFLEERKNDEFRLSIARHQAELIMEAAGAVRSYTITHIKDDPNVMNNRQIIERDGGVGVFVKQTVPAWAAQEVFRGLTESPGGTPLQDGAPEVPAAPGGGASATKHGPYESFSYYELSPNPSNSKDSILAKPDSYKALLDKFVKLADRPGQRPCALDDRSVDDAVLEKWAREFERSQYDSADLDQLAHESRTFLLARPLIATRKCLDCHDKTEKISDQLKAMLNEYPTTGYGWQLGEVVAVRLVEVPLLSASDVPFRDATRWIAVGGILLLWLAANLGVWKFAKRPVDQLGAWARDVSKGKLPLRDFEGRPTGEVGVLAEAFNTLCRKLLLEKAKRNKDGV